MPAPKIAPQQRRCLPTTVKLTGRTVRVTGTLDLDAAAQFFSIGSENLARAEKLNLSDTWRIHPSGILPLLAWSLNHKHRFAIRAVDNPWVQRFLAMHAYDRLFGANEAVTGRLAAHCAKHYSHDDSDPHEYVTRLLHEILERRRCGRDVAESLEWSSSELIGNVFDHAESPIGVVTQFLLLREKPSVAVFALVDTGMGIRASLSPKFPNLKSDAEAIELAMQRGITSKRENQGWGLFGSEAIVRAARGRLVVWSGDSRLVIGQDGGRRYDDVPYFRGTVIEWMLPLTANIDLKKVLENPNRASSYQLEQYEPDLGTITFQLSRESVAFRDRASGKKMRTKLLNLIENSGAKHCCIDFDGVGTVTSSFADEFLAKTAFMFGPKFKNFVSVTKISDVNKAIIEIAIQARQRSEEAARIPQFIRSRG